jgi:hypothetical protein
MSNVEPIVNLPLPLAIDGLYISMPVGYPNYVGGVQPLPSFLNCPQPLFVSSAVVGVNGLDSGAIAASSNYIIYLIGDSRNFKPVAGLLSLASNQYPLLPFGYDSYRIIGFVATDGASHFVLSATNPINPLNAKYAKTYFLQPPVSVLSGGDATTFTAIALTSAIPTTTDAFVIAYINVIFTPAAIGDTVQFRPTGSTATAGLVTIVGVAAGVSQTECVTVMTAVSAGEPSIDYKVTASGDSVSVLVEGYSVTLA